MALTIFAINNHFKLAREDLTDKAYQEFRRAQSAEEFVQIFKE